MTKVIKPRRQRACKSENERKKRVQLYLNPALADFLEAEDQPEPERKPIALRRKREAAEMLLQANIQSRIL